jgi:diguanylate cyclase (GGDEF)-like protein
MAHPTPNKHNRSLHGIVILAILCSGLLGVCVKSSTSAAPGTPQLSASERAAENPSQGILSETQKGAVRSLKAKQWVFPLIVGRGIELPLGAQLGIMLCGGFLILFMQRELVREKQLSRTDPLTGVANHRAFLETVSRRFSYLRTAKGVITIAYIDLDDFKGINDRWGHRAGDALLHLVGNTIRKNLRHTDCVARLGGDEFAVLFYDTGLAAAQSAMAHVFEHLSRTLQQRARSTTCSIGAIVYHSCPPSTGFALRRADELMYLAKRGGKNRLFFKIWGQPLQGNDFLRSEEIRDARAKTLVSPSRPLP